LGRLGLFLTAMAPALAFAGNDLGEALAGSSYFGYVKAMLVSDDKKGGRLNQNTPGVGGKVGVETGDYAGFRFRGAWYVTSDLGMRSGDPRQTDAYMFDVDKRPYSTLGEASLRFGYGNSALTVGRQEIFSPIINSYEYRIIPNLFEAATFTNKDLGATTLTLAYVSKMSGLDGLVSFSDFRSMSQQTYTSLMVTPDGRVDANQGDTFDLSKAVGNRGVWMAGAVYEDKHRLQVWHYHGVDTLNTLYVDGALRQAISTDYSGVLEAQAYRVSEAGRFKTYLEQHGLNGRYGLFGLKGTLAHQPSGLSLALAATRFSGDRNTVTAYGNWGGYPEFVLMPYLYAENSSASAIAGSHSTKVTVIWNLAGLGLQNQSLLFGHARINIDESILAGADIIANSLIYRAKLTSSLSARVHFESRNSGHSRYNNEFVTAALRYDF